MEIINKKNILKLELDIIDLVLLFILSILSFFIRYWIIWHPSGVVFDEVYFGNFSNYYIKSQYYHDIHPPLAKLIMYFVANLSEYDGNINFNHSPDGYGVPDYIQLRLTPATFSALCIPLIYLSVRFLGFSKIAAFTSSFLILCDISLGVEGRHILSDGILHFFSILHITILFYTISLSKLDYWFHIFHLLTGITLGAASSCKNTAWGLAVLDAFSYIYFLYNFHEEISLDYLFDLIIYGGSLLFLDIFIYFIIFSIHFILLPIAGPGTVFLEEKMKEQLIPNLSVNSSLKARHIFGPSLIQRVFVYSYKTHKGNMGITQFHDSQSFPKHWPILGSVSVFFWSKNGREIRCLGNAFTYYFSLLGLVLSLFGFKHKHYLKALLNFIGYCSCYFPFYLIPRVLYLYHYLIPLMISCISFGISLDFYLPPKFKGIISVLVCFLTLIGFWIWIDYLYGLPYKDRDFAIWNQNWIDGDMDHKKRREEHYKTKK